MSKRNEQKQKVMRRVIESADWNYWGDDAGFEENGLGGLLGVHDDDAAFLMKADVIEATQKGRDFTASTEAVLAFLEEYGEEWFRSYLQRQIQMLRDRLTRKRGGTPNAEEMSSALRDLHANIKGSAN